MFILVAKIPTDRVSGRSKGFGFITYASEDEADNAIKELNGKACIYCPFIVFIGFTVVGTSNSM